jgi:ketosteroid isomerase-like protein
MHPCLSYCFKSEYIARNLLGKQQPVDLEAEAAAFRQLTDVDWLEAGKAKNLDHWMSFYTYDTIFFPPGGPPIMGKEAIRKLISEFLGNPGNTATWETTTVEVSRSADMAYSYGPQQTTVIDEQGDPVTHNQKWSIVWKKQPDDSWKCAFMTMDYDSSIETASPAGQPEQGSEDSAVYKADVQAILDFEQTVYDAQIAGDIEAWLSSFAEDVTLFPPNAPPLTSKLAIRQFNTPIFEQFDLHESSDDREVVVAGDWGYIRSHWTWIQTPKDGGAEVKDIGNSIWIVRRQPNGSWKIARAIWNSDKPILGEE